MTYPMPCPDELRQLCYEWHSGQASAMYSVASTGVIRDQAALLALSADLCHARIVCKGRSSWVSATMEEWDWQQLERWENWCDAQLMLAVAQGSNNQEFGNGG